MTIPNNPRFEAFLQHDLDLIQAKLLEMAALAGRALSQALQAFLKPDRQMAYAVILHDQDVDVLDAELDRLCLEFIIRHVPAAGHLRFVYSASKVVNSLERIGDYAESIARQGLVVAAPPHEPLAARFTEMAALAIPMLHDAVQAFVHRDPELARATMVVEPRVNEVRDTLNGELVEWRRGGELPIEALPPMLTVARRLERVSDHATNICEEALYSATGEYVRHVPRDTFRVLFVDERNHCLSQMAEAIGCALDARRFSFLSAGVTAGDIDPATVQFLASKGLDIAKHATKSVAEIPDVPRLEVVVGLCREASSMLPRRPSRTLGLDWILRDPSTVRGSQEETRAAFDHAYATLTAQIRELVQAIVGSDRNPLYEQNRI